MKTYEIGKIYGANELKSDLTLRAVVNNDWIYNFSNGDGIYRFESTKETYGKNFNDQQFKFIKYVNLNDLINRN